MIANLLPLLAHGVFRFILKRKLLHIRCHSIQMEITKSQFRTNCVRKWLVCIILRGTYFMFLRPFRIKLLLGCKQSKNLQK